MVLDVKRVGEDLILEIPRVVVEELGVQVGDNFRVFLSFNGEKVSIVYEPVKEA